VAAMRYPRVEGRPLREPFGRPRRCPPARRHLTGASPNKSNYARADVVALAPQGELLCGLMIESPEGTATCRRCWPRCPASAVIFTGEGDLSQELGHPRQYRPIRT